jgi:lipopolysaccharide export system permease protein
LIPRGRHAFWPAGGFKPLKRLDLYLARLIAVPLLATIAITIALMFLQYLPVLFDRLVQQGASTSVIWKMLGFLMPEYLDLALPIGLLLGTMMAFRRLSLSQEMDVLTASGMGAMRLLRVPLLYAVVISVLAVGMTGFVQPLGAAAYDKLGFLAKTGAFGLPLEVASFNELADGLTLRMEQRDSSSGKMQNVFVHSAIEGTRPFVVTAREGQFIKAPRSHMIMLRLNGGRVIMEKAKVNDMQVVNFDEYDIPITAPTLANYRPRPTDEEEMTTPQLVDSWRDASLPKASRHLLHGEFQRRIIVCLIPFLIPFLAFAAFRPPLRSTSPLGLIAGLFLLVLLIKILDLGVRLTEWPASPILWTAFAVFAGLVFRIFYIAAYTVAGEPLALLYRARDSILRFMRKAGFAGQR